MLVLKHIPKKQERLTCHQGTTLGKKIAVR